MTATTGPAAPALHPDEPHDGSLHSRLNALRAAVLGANDGIVSVSGLVVGVAGATTDRTTIAVAGLAGLVAGALSMAVGEYVSVSTQRDTERALVDKERRELREEPVEELAELTQLYVDKGLTPALAAQVADELTESDALRAHLDVELGIDPDELVSPWQAAGASLLAFTLGALLPLLTVLLSPAAWRVLVTFLAVAAALGLTGWLSARAGDADVRPAVLRVVGGGVLAMAVTYAVGSALGVGLG